MIFYLITISVVLYVWLKWHFSYWSRTGLECYDTNFFENIFTKVYDSYFYFKRKGLKHGGSFIFFKSIYIPVDLDVLKNIVQTDFQYFVNHGFMNNPPPILKHIGNMDDEEWKIWRTKLSPTFTSGKMKMMFPTMTEKAFVLTEVLKEQATINEAINIQDIMSKYTTDVIISTVLGVDCNSFKNPSTDILKHCDLFLERIKKIGLFYQLPPFVLKLLKIELVPKEIETFFLNVINNETNLRESNNVFRKDFMHLLLQLKNTGKVGTDDDHNILDDRKKSGNHLSLVEMTAHSLAFFGAGLKLLAVTITCALLELAKDKEIQDKLRNDIRNVFMECDGEITYEAIMKMEYLDRIVQETLRKYPPAQMIPRTCNKDYPVPGTNFVVEKGQQIILPFRAIQHDPEYWPEPEKFDPDRFSPENKARRHRFAYLPFGEGPRMCIGARYAMVQTKIGIASIIKNFKLTLSDKSSNDFKIDYKSGLLSVNGIIWMNIEKVD